MRRALDLSFGDSNTADREAKDSETESANSREELAGLIPNAYVALLREGFSFILGYVEEEI